MLQEKTFEMYRLLSSRSGLIKDITIDDTSYEVRIVDRNGHEIRKIGPVSKVEKEVFAVSLLWGLAQTSQLKLPIIIDTPLSRLDSTHRDNIVNNYFPNAGEQVIILSTDTEIDTNYYKALKPRLVEPQALDYDHRQERTTFAKGTSGRNKTWQTDYIHQAKLTRFLVLFALRPNWKKPHLLVLPSLSH